MTEPTTIELIPGSREWKKLRHRAMTDLYWLNAKVLGHESLVPMTLRAHYAMCRFAERRTGIPQIDNMRIQLIQVARGWGKSTLITKGRTIQRLLVNRDWAAAIANEKAGNAEAFLDMIKQEFMHNDFLKALFPEHIPDYRKTTWKASRIVIQRSKPNPVNPSVLAAGVDTAVTGVHMDEWICDDLISDEAADNAMRGSWTEMEKTFRWVDRLQFLLTNFKRDPITFIGTPWWPGDVYEYVIQKFGRGEEVVQHVWTLRLPDGDIQEIIIETVGEIAILKLRPIEKGRAVFPDHLSMDTMEKLREDDPTTYAAQILLNPTAGGVANFKAEWLRTFEWEGQRQIRYRDDNEKTHFERTIDMSIVLSVDPAISEKSTAARSAVVCCGSNGHNIFMLEAWARRCSPTELAAQILKFYKEYKPIRIVIEKAGYQMALAEILKLEAERQNLGQLPIYEHNVGGDQKKSMRIAGLEPFFRKGLIYYNASQHEFYEEYIQFSSDIGNRLVDTLDALAMQKESWDHLLFLGDPEKQGGRDEWHERARKAQDRIREHSRRRTRSWHQ